MAHKVFLVEDESVIREGLRDNMPWQQYGFTLVGEAADGEMALPMIRKERPDVVITDIKMPFMDGLSLTHIVKQEFPETKIIIISGYDDFEYARQAIKEGVDQYLLKPITRSMLQKALAEVKEKIDSEQEQKNYLKKYQDDMQEYEQSFRRNFFEKVFEGNTPLPEIYAEASRHSLEIDAPAYNLILMCVQENGNPASGEACQDCEEELMRYFLRFQNRCLTFRWSINVYGILVKGESESVEERTKGYLTNIEEICSKYQNDINWYAATGSPVSRFSMLRECYAQVNHIFSYRFFVSDRHILTEDLIDNTESTAPESDMQGIDRIDTDLVSPELIRGFLSNGQKNEIPEFVSNFILGIQDALRSRLFWDYLLLNLRFVISGYISEMGGSAEDFLSENTLEKFRVMEISKENMREYMETMIRAAVDFRDRENDSRGKSAIRTALSYIEENFAKDSLSLNEVADATAVTPSYFSAMFSQEMGQTFVEYVTDLRMAEAKKLLLTDGIRSGDVGPMVGYKNPNYFSFVFKKTQGCTPREYRSAHTE